MVLPSGKQIQWTIQSRTIPFVKYFLCLPPSLLWNHTILITSSRESFERSAGSLGLRIQVHIFKLYFSLSYHQNEQQPLPKENLQLLDSPFSGTQSLFDGSIVGVWEATTTQIGHPRLQIDRSLLKFPLYHWNLVRLAYCLSFFSRERITKCWVIKWNVIHQFSRLSCHLDSSYCASQTPPYSITATFLYVNHSFDPKKWLLGAFRKLALRKVMWPKLTPCRWRLYFVMTYARTAEWLSQHQIVLLRSPEGTNRSLGGCVGNLNWAVPIPIPQISRTVNLWCHFHNYPVLSSELPCFR
jgi:hypothetical protein